MSRMRLNANRALQRYLRPDFPDDLADDAGVRAVRPGPQNFQRPRRVAFRDERDEPALARDLKRIESQHFAGGVNVLAHRNQFFLDENFQVGGLGNFIQRARQPAARQIAQTMDFNSRLEQIQNRLMHRRGIAFNRGFQIPALRARP